MQAFERSVEENSNQTAKGEEGYLELWFHLCIFVGPARGTARKTVNGFENYKIICL